MARVPYARRAYEPDYRMGDLIRSQGRNAAEAELRRGDISAQLWANVGRSVSDAVGSYAQAKSDEPKRDMERLKLDEQKRTMRDDATAKALMPFALQQREDGLHTFDRDLLTKEYTAAGMGDRLPGLLQALDGFESSALSLKKLNADMAAAKTDAIANLAYGVLQAGASPEAVKLAIQMGAKNGLVTQQEVSEALQGMTPDPESITERMMLLANQSPKVATLLQKQPTNPTEASLAAEAARGNPQAIKALELLRAQQKPAQPPNVGSFEDYVVRRFGPQPTPAQIEQARKTYTETGRDADTPSFQTREVLGDDGKPIIANFDARTGAYLTPDGKRIANPGRIPSASETQDARKFSQAGPIMSAVAELSERINTLQGMAAKAVGEVERQKAKINLNDDIAEYEALVSGFTPLVARALGHSGVLTQQDVDSVKALFPRPGDSKSLRDRKIARVMGLIGQLEGVATVPGTKPPAEPKPPVKVGGFTVREKP